MFASSGLQHFGFSNLVNEAGFEQDCMVKPPNNSCAQAPDILLPQPSNHA